MRDQFFNVIREQASNALRAAEEHKAAMGAVNWGDLSVRAVLKTEDETGHVGWLVIIEEASPGCGLCLFVQNRITVPNVEVQTSW